VIMMYDFGFVNNFVIFKAQEDAAMLRSLVIPLEQEIDALKVKLRQTDQDLQWFYANSKV
jgi:hypothetical protein